MLEIGKQYSKDNITDPSGFLRRARLHQSKFRAEALGLTYDTYGNYLTREDGLAGKNFYEGFGIFEAVKNYRGFNKPLYCNMLRSEHIPFNLFIPFNRNKEYCRDVFNRVIGNYIKSIDRIEIEYAPKPKENYLNDGTSFDAYIEYSHVDGSKGMIGIEIKYTEKEYKLTPNSKQEKDIKDLSSKYFTVTKQSNIYKPETVTHLPSDQFRQVWRNHILGESILQTDSNKFKHFSSLTIFPKDNQHFIHTSKEYASFLTDENKFIALTYEDYFNICQNQCPDPEFKKWIDYLRLRYLVPEDIK